MFGWAVLVDDAVGPRRVVGQGLEGAGVQASFEPLSELVHGPVGGLVGDDDLVEFLMAVRLMESPLRTSP